MNRRREREASEKEPGSGWAVTYADLATLLLAFFVLLVSMSGLNTKRLQKAFDNFQSTAGMMYFRDFKRSSGGRDALERDMKYLLKEIQKVCGSEIRDSAEVSDSATESFQNELASSPEAVWMNMYQSEQGFSMVLSSGKLFDCASATLYGSAYALLEKIGSFLQKSDYRANIDVHTTAINSFGGAFSSADALSLAQAQAVLNCLMLRSNVDPKRLAMGGYGNSRPLEAEGVSVSGTVNDRVEIVFEKVTKQE